MKHDRYYNVAKSVSKLSTFPSIHIGCIVVLNKDIISTGFNKKKSHPVQKILNIHRFDAMYEDSCKHYIHAELVALLKIPESVDLSKAIMYIYREGINGKLLISKPCPACMAEIQRRGIKTIYYTGDGKYLKITIP